MRLKISHKTEYVYETAMNYALQRLRVRPQNNESQKIISWDMKISGAIVEVEYLDHLGNNVALISCHGDSYKISATVTGEIETTDTSGVLGETNGYVPLWLYKRQTALTEPGKGVYRLIEGLSDDDLVPQLHQLMELIRSEVDYEIGATHSATTAEEAIKHGKGVCQDHSHIFLSACRLLGIPARYVSGYLLIDGVTEQVASHAWAEAFVSGLGWVGFDVSNKQSPDERYVKVAVGLDYSDAMPVSGIRTGTSDESLIVSITVEQ